MGCCGIFKGETVVGVQQQTQAVFEGFPKNRLATAVLRAVQTKQNISSTLQFNNLTSFGNISSQYYTYGKDKYFYGIPESNLAAKNYNITEVEIAINADVGTASTVLSSYLYYPTERIWANWVLQQTYPTFDYSAQEVTISGTLYSIVSITGDFGEIVVELDSGTVTTTLELTETPSKNVYYIAEFIFDSDPLTEYLWLYDPTTGVYPSLNVDVTIDTAQFYPIVPIRLNDRNINTDKTTEAYLTTKTLLGYSKLDLDDLTTRVTKKIDEDGNEVNIDNLDKISDIFILYGVNIYAESQQEKKALFEIIEQLEALSYFDETTSVADDGTNNFSIRSATFLYELIFDYINTSVVSVIKGKVNTYHTEIDVSSSPSSFIIYKQITGNQCLKYEVVGLHITHSIKEAGQLKEATIELEAHRAGQDLSDTKKSFIIPLNRPQTEGLSPIDADFLFTKSLHLVFYAGDSKYVKWYKTGTFLNLLKFALYVLAVVSLISGSADLYEFFVNLATYLAAKYAIEYVLLKLLDKYGDNEVIRALAIIAAIVVTIAISPGDFGDLAFADQMIQGVNALASVTGIVVKSEFALLEEEYATFTQSKSEYEKELETAQKFLNADTWITPEELISTQAYRYETAEDFFARTLCTYPGQLSFDQLHSYVDNKLNLDYIQL